MTKFKECSKYSKGNVKMEWEKIEEVGVYLKSWRNSFFLITGIGISNIGNCIYLIALNLLVIDLTGTSLGDCKREKVKLNRLTCPSSGRQMGNGQIKPVNLTEPRWKV